MKHTSLQPESKEYGSFLDAHEIPDLVIRPHRLELAALLVITVLGAGVRIFLWDTQSIPGGDGFAYIWLAKMFSGGPVLETHHPFGFPFLIHVAHYLVDDWVLAGRLVALSSGILLPALTWGLAACLIDRPHLRLIPAAAVAFTPLPIRYSITVMSDVPYMALLLVAFILVFRKRFLTAGILAGFAYTLRPEGLLVLMTLAALHWRRPRQALTLVGGVLLVVAPYVIAVGVTQDEWTLSRKTSNISSATWEESELRAGDQPGELSLKGRVDRHAESIVRDYPGRSVGVLVQLLRQGGWTAIAVGIAGFFGPAFLLVAGVVQIFALPLSFLAERVRFFFPLLPLFWISAMVAVDRTTRPVLATGLVVVVIGGIVTSAILERTQYDQNEEGYFPELVEAGVWLKSIATPTSIVYDRKPYTAFYSGAMFRFPPTGTYEEVMAHIMENHGDYVVANNWVLERWRPELLPLLEDPVLVEREDRLNPIYYSESKRGLRTAIFRVLYPGDSELSEREEAVRLAYIRMLEAR